MALSGTYDSTTTVATVIEEAMSLIGGKVGGDTVSDEDQASGIKALRFMLRTWAANGIRLALSETQSVTMIAATSQYTLNPRTLEASWATRRTGASTFNDVPIRIVTREEFARIPNKTITGPPFMVWLDRQRTATVLNVYPIPTAAEVSDTMKIRLETKRMIQDPTAANEDIDFPPEWMEAVIYNLAERMAPRLELPIPPLVAARAAELYESLEGQDREGSVYMRPGPRR